MMVQEPSAVDQYLLREIELGRMLRVSPVPHVPDWYDTKKEQAQLIVDLSSPKGSSVNDSIDKAWSFLEYVSIDHLATIVRKLGQGALLIKADVKEAYRMVPVHPQDRWLLGV